MSGFVGWIDFRRDLDTQDDVLRAMTKTMNNRGPDAEGTWLSRHAALGHRRSSAADADGGRQPVLAETEEGTIALVYAGAIYNRIELAQDIERLGARLSSRSDAEVLLQSYLLWGKRFVERVDGIFAFAIWDERIRQLLLGRDRLGVKPLYYFEYAGGILFASEPKGIMANRLFEPRLNLSALPILLQPRLSLAGETPLVGLAEVRSAHVICYSETGLSHQRFWALTSAPHHESAVETARHVRALMEDIVARQLTCDVARGAMLSGGVDSTSVAALAMQTLRRAGEALDTFCIQFESDAAHFVPSELRPDMDSPYAAKAAAFIGTRHQTVTVTTQDLFDAIPDTRRARDLPGWGQFDASMYVLFRHMRERCSVALTGEAADEIFGGYPYFFKPDLVQRDRFPWLADGPKLSDYLSGEIRAVVDPEEDERARYSQLISAVPRLPGEDVVNARMREVFYLGLSGPLAAILDRKDRMSMAVGLEVRVPFCDHRLVHYVWNVPWSIKSTGGLKGLLKTAMADLLPPGTLERKKSAYPHIQNPDNDLAVTREAKRIVNDKGAPVAALFDTARMNAFIDECAADALGNRNDRRFPGGTNAANMLIHLVEMNTWIETYKVSFRG